MNKSSQKPINYDLALSKLIPQLNRLSYLRGSEGKVYFVDDKFVVKEYLSHDEDPLMFNLFCRELREFGEKGHNVPKVYAWKTVSKPHEGNTFYVLRERINGQLLRAPSIEQLFGQFKGVCSKRKFDLAVNNPDSNLELREQIEIAFIKNFLQINNLLVGVSDNKLEKMILSDYQMSMQSRYSMVDFQAQNVMYDKRGFQFIDNAFVGVEMEPASEDESIKRTISDMFLLFSEGIYLKQVIKASPVKSDKIHNLMQQNEQACFEAMIRLVPETTRLLGSNKLHKYTHATCVSLVNKLFDPQKAKQISDEIEIEK